MNKKSITVFFIIVLCVTAFCVGYLYVTKGIKNDITKGSLVKNMGIEQEKKQNVLVTASKDEVVVLPTAKIKVKQTHKKCGHTIAEEISVPEEVVNMTEKEVKQYYFGWDVEAFSEKEISISKESDDICEEHYTVKDEDGKVTVYRRGNRDEEILVYTTDVDTKYLPNADRKKLENGISIVGKNNLSVLLEDYE